MSDPEKPLSAGHWLALALFYLTALSGSAVLMMALFGWGPSLLTLMAVTASAGLVRLIHRPTREPAHLPPDDDPGTPGMEE